MNEQWYGRVQALLFILTPTLIITAEAHNEKGVKFPLCLGQFAQTIFMLFQSEPSDDAYN